MISYDEGVQSSIIPEFPDYAVTNDGRVFNTRTGRDMVLSPTLQGELTVGMMRGGEVFDDIDHPRRQHRRSVKVLVAEAFVDGKSEVFDTPIQLDGNKYNLNSYNIRWRPRWFAWRYARQFSEIRPGFFYRGPILDVINGIQYTTILEASLTTGTLCEDIHASILDERLVFPTGERYVYI